jgi:hypothetical protein
MPATAGSVSYMVNRPLPYIKRSTRRYRGFVYALVMHSCGVYPR